MRILDKVTKKIAQNAGFETAKKAKEFIENNIPNYKDYQFDQLTSELKRKYKEHLIIKAKEINDDINENNVKVVVINKRKLSKFSPKRIRINIDKSHEQYNKLYKENGHVVYSQAEFDRYKDKLNGIEFQVEELPNEFNPKWIHINNDDFYTSARKILTSEQYDKLLDNIRGTKDLNRIMYTQGEYDRYMDRIKNALYKYNVSYCFDDVSVKELYHDEEIGRYYKINGLLFDYGSFLIDKFTCEAPILKSNQGIELRCILNCIISQTKLGKKQLSQLYLYNDLPITLDTLFKISEDLKLHVRVYDCELNLWREYDNLDRTKSKNYERFLVCIVVKNGHAYNIKPEYRKYTELKPKSSPKVSINPRDDTIPEVIYGSFIFSDSLLLDNVDIDLINDMDAPRVYYSLYNIDYLQLVEYLMSKKVYPCILSSKNTMVSINFKYKGNEIQLRNHDFKHDYIEDVPYDSNYTLTSVAKYLFTRHIERSVLCLHDPVMINIFKSLCIPKNEIGHYDLTDTYVYQIDINKAYRSFSKNIGFFDTSPIIVTIDKPITKRNTVKPGIYYCNLGEYKWITNEQLEYALTKSSLDVKYAIYFDYQSDVIYTFADYLQDCFLDIDSKDFKFMFNSFVGSLHPCESEHNMTMVFKDDKDLSRFLMCGQKHIDRIQEINSSYIVSFRYHDTITSQNAHHIAAQIISRCKLYIEKVTDQILSKYPDATIIGSMTDSIIFANKQELDLTFLNIGPNIGQFSLVSKRNIVSRGPGQYCLFNDYESDYIMKYQGRSNDRTLSKLLEQPNKLLDIIRELQIEPVPKQIEFSTKNTNICDLFIGGPGVGKSRYIDDTFKNKSYVRLAGTGIAACAIKGRTISSYFNLGEKNQHTMLQSLQGINYNRRSKIANADAFIIDECYATSEKVMTLMSDLLKFICCDHRDFGNKELILVGDDRQLSFNIESDSGFMNSNLFKRLTVARHELSFHEDGRLTVEYYNTLNYLRHDRSPLELIKFVETLNTSSTEFPDSVTVTYTNDLVQQINNQKYLDYSEPEHIHIRKDCDDKEIKTKYKKSMPIMLKKNDDKKGSQVYNGKLCTLLNYEKALEISYNYKTKDNNIVRHDLTLGNYHSFVIAYAITIHKVQGLTLDNINIVIEKKYLSHPDATRLLYVALSRVRDSTNVYIKIQ